MSDELPIQVTCPLGSQCQEVKDNTIHRCAWFLKMKGTDATGEEHDEWRCSISWMPILQLENAQQTREMSASVDSFRNENSKRQNAALDSMRLLDQITQPIPLQSN